MQIAILIFDGLTALDAVGPYEALQTVPDWQVQFVGAERRQIRTDSGALGLAVDHALEEVPYPDVVLVPGGPGSRRVSSDQAVLSWLREVDAGTRWTTSVCTGSLVLASAGLLAGRRATTHWLQLDRLAALGARPTTERFVEDGKYLTAAGVSSGIDMALHLIGREAGPIMAQAVQLGIEYDPQPPHDSGSPLKASPQVIAAAAALAKQRSGDAPRPRRRGPGAVGA